MVFVIIGRGIRHQRLRPTLLSVGSGFALGDVGVCVAISAVIFASEGWRDCRSGSGRGLGQGRQLLDHILDLRTESARRRIGLHRWKERQLILGRPAGCRGGVSVDHIARQLGRLASMRLTVEVIAQFSQGGALLFAGHALVLQQNQPSGSTAGSCRRLGRLRAAGPLVLNDGNFRAVQRLAGFAQDAHIRRMSPDEFHFCRCQMVGQ